MTYEVFQTYLEVFHFNEIIIIGKDICVDGNWIHVVGMGRKKEGAFLYILEQQPTLEENPIWRADRTNRESLLESAEERERSTLGINKITIGEDVFEFQGGTSGNLAQQAELSQAYLFFQQMMENGWRISEESCFYQLDWSRIGLVELRLKDFHEKMPELSGDIRQMTLSPSSKSYIVQVPVRLEQGKTNQLHFSLEEGGEEIICYINQVSMMEPLVEEEKKFNDVQYQEKALQYVTKEEFERMRKTAMESLEAECPRGMGYFAIEYECTKENFSAQFYATADLDSIPEPKQGCTSMLMMGGKPEQETGPHGYRNRCRVVQYAVPVGTEALEAELFMMIEMIPEKEVVL